MPGSWEISPQVLVVILTRENTTTAWAFGFKNLQIPGNYTGLSGMPFDHARNTGCLKTLELGFDYCFFLDDDIIPPPDAILRLMSHNLPIVSGIYYRRNNPICPVMMRNVPGGKQWVSEYAIPDLIEVDYVGAGCLLIHANVLKTMPQPWFDWRCDRFDLPETERMSEDFAFCENAKKYGYKTFVDTSVQCKHVGFFESKFPGQLTPLELI